MCGIIGYVGFKDPKPILIEGLKQLEYRGYDSAGVAILENGQFDVYRAKGRLSNLESLLKDKIFEGRVGIGHTRWATHGAPSEQNAHPHRVGSVTLVHNGIIENYKILINGLEAAGRKLKTETDTEIVAHLIDLEILNGKNLKEAVVSVLPRLQGNYAFVITSDMNPNQMLGVRHGAPLLVGVGKKEYFLASDVQAVLKHTKDVVFLKDGEIAVCEKGQFEILTHEGKKVEPELTSIQWSADDLDKQGYKHYMLKEIHEQPIAVAKTIDSSVEWDKKTLYLPGLEKAASILKNIKHIELVACGTARHAAMVGQYYIEKIARIPCHVDFASEFRYRERVFDKNSLCILVSQSGETADTLAALKALKESGIATLAICNVKESPLAREADWVCYTEAGPEIGVASTKAFSTQLVVLYMLALHLARVQGTQSEEILSAMTDELRTLPSYLDRVMDYESSIRTFCMELELYRHFFFLGRGVHYPIVLEGALKLKEISYLHAEGYPGGELKHGPIALIDRKVVSFVVAPLEKESALDPHPTQILRDKVMANLQQVKARGGKLVGIGSLGDKDFQNECWFYQPLPKLSWGLNPIIASVPLQFFAYHIADLRGTDVDKPRNLAKSVTVE